MDDELKRKFIILGIIGALFALALWMWLGGRGEASEPEPTPAPPTEAAIERLPTLTPTFTLEPTVAPLVEPVEAPTESNNPQPPTEEQLQATATYQAAISRPAGNPQNSPFFIGVITYEAGCSVTNLGFTTAGYNGQPFYLYFSAPLDRDPNMQMVNVSGYIQQFEGCQYPVLMVSQIYWLDQQGTPAPLAIGGPDITGTITATLAWGKASTPAPTPKMASAAPVAQQPTITPTYWLPNYDIPSPQTPLPTYTPYPTYTPIPPEKIIHTVVPHIPTQTPQPTYTPYPTPTPNPSANVNGPVISVAGCPATNIAIQTGPGQLVYLMFAGAALPPSGQPTDYHALAVGVLENVCNGQAIKANSITWYIATATPTPTSTMTPTATLTPTITPTPTETATITPTETITP